MSCKFTNNFCLFFFSVCSLVANDLHIELGTHQSAHHNRKRVAVEASRPISAAPEDMAC